MPKDPVSKTKDVRAAVEQELGFDPRVDAAHIAVRNIVGDVTLTGTVPIRSTSTCTSRRRWTAPRRFPTAAT